VGFQSVEIVGLYFVRLLRRVLLLLLLLLLGSACPRVVDVDVDVVAVDVNLNVDAGGSRKSRCPSIFHEPPPGTSGAANKGDDDDDDAFTAAAVVVAEVRDTEEVCWGLQALVVAFTFVVTPAAEVVSEAPAPFTSVPNCC
jgi:hypothetical protein